MDDKQFLIAHKVRGEQAFDVAVRFHVSESEYWWIIPTSGHRAYPFWWHEIGPMDHEAWQIPPMPEDLRDHYAACDELKPRRKPTGPGAVPTLDDL